MKKVITVQIKIIYYEKNLHEKSPVKVPTLVQVKSHTLTPDKYSSIMLVLYTMLYFCLEQNVD